MVDELAVAHVLLGAVALISCLSVPDKRTIRRMPRALWVAVIVLVPLAGSIGWFLAGRPHRLVPPRSRWRRLLGSPAAPRAAAPEDDPEFLRSLDHPPRDEDEQHRPDQGPGDSPPSR